ncbi:MAG TPA: hypothetical protein VLM38_18545, partial [Blastocatellia bacterium]|nr:hypothetical protein [Blastocatellia bacterium]
WRNLSTETLRSFSCASRAALVGNPEQLIHQPVTRTAQEFHTTHVKTVRNAISARRQVSSLASLFDLRLGAPWDCR